MQFKFHWKFYLAILGQENEGIVGYVSLRRVLPVMRLWV
jgi:hypothetical protein